MLLIFLRAKESIAVAERVTSGYLQLYFLQMENVAGCYHGGITAYNLNQKTKWLKINPEEGKRTNCVSQDIAETMALQTHQLFQSDWAIAVTGKATPVPEFCYALYAYYAISYKNSLLLSDRIDIISGRDQRDYSRHLLKTLLACVRQKSG